MRALGLTRAMVTVDAVIAEAPHMRRHFRIIGGAHAAFAGRHVLDGMKRETGDIAQCPDLTILVDRARRMAGIRDDANAAAARDLAQRVVIGGLAGIIHRHNGLGARRKALLYRCRIDQQRVFFNIGENRRGAFIDGGIGGSGKGQRRHNHFVTGTNTDGAHGGMQGGGTGIDCHTLGSATMGSEGLFEFRNTRSRGQPAGNQRLDNCLDVGIADFLAAIGQKRKRGRSLPIRHRPWPTEPEGPAHPAFPDWCRWNS